MNAASRAAQEAFVAAILGQGELPALTGRSGVPNGLARGLQAYRGNAQALSARALEGAFPRLAEELDDAFEAMAWTFWRRHPPHDGDLGHWGGELAAFLEAQPGMDAALPDLARLEWAVHCAERAADDEFDAESLGLLATLGADAIQLRLAPGTVVLAQSDGALLVWRRAWQVESLPIAADVAAFMAAVLQRASLAGALDAAGAAFDFGAWLQKALAQAWLRGAAESAA